MTRSGTAGVGVGAPAETPSIAAAPAAEKKTVAPQTSNREPLLSVLECLLRAEAGRPNPLAARNDSAMMAGFPPPATRHSMRERSHRPSHAVTELVLPSGTSGWN